MFIFFILMTLHLLEGSGDEKNNEKCHLQYRINIGLTHSFSMDLPISSESVLLSSVTAACGDTLVFSWSVSKLQLWSTGNYHSFMYLESLT